MHLLALQSVWCVLDRNRSHVQVGGCTLLTPQAEYLVLKAHSVQYLPVANLIAFTTTSGRVRAINDVARLRFGRLMAPGLARPG